MEDELALVSSCQSLRRGQVWVHWLGYGAERSCWVDATSEVEVTGCPDSADVLLPGIDASKVSAAMSLIESPDAEAEAAAILGGGRPPRVCGEVYLTLLYLTLGCSSYITCCTKFRTQRP